jgi:hypothetical protein
MIRERLQLLKAAVITRFQPLKEATNEAAADMIDEQVTGLVNRIAYKVSVMELTDAERAQISAAYTAKDNQTLTEGLFQAQSAIRLRFYNEVLQPEMDLIYKFRFFAVLLDRATYNNLIAKTASLFEAMSQMTAQVSVGLLKAEVDALSAAVKEADAAKVQYRAFGPTIEE